MESKAFGFFSFRVPGKFFWSGRQVLKRYEKNAYLPTPWRLGMYQSAQRNNQICDMFIWGLKLSYKVSSYQS